MEYLAAYIIWGVILYFILTSNWCLKAMKEYATKQDYSKFAESVKNKNKTLILCVTLGGLATVLVFVGTVVKWLLGLFGGKNK